MNPIGMVLGLLLGLLAAVPSVLLFRRGVRIGKALYPALALGGLVFVGVEPVPLFAALVSGEQWEFSDLIAPAYLAIPAGASAGISSYVWMRLTKAGREAFLSPPQPVPPAADAGMPNHVDPKGKLTE